MECLEAFSVINLADMLQEVISILVAAFNDLIMNHLPEPLVDLSFFEVKRVGK